MSGSHNGASSRAKVWVRTRPTCNFANRMINILPDGMTINIHCDRDPRKGFVNNQKEDWSFRLDGVLHNTSQQETYDAVAADVVKSALDGYNGTIMCYGQTGAGKTFTMTGATEHYKHRGLIPRALAQLFTEIEQRTDYAINLRVSFMEIYNEAIADLLATLPESLKNAQSNVITIVEDDQGVFVRGLQTHVAQNEEDALNMLFEGETNRAIAAHTLNKQSSRSHCIFTVYIESRSRVESNAKYTQSKLNFVDLAGSERLGKTQSEGKVKEEAMHINKSLSFLEQVVMALGDKNRDKFIPFRQAKLTHCLKDSLGGNCCTRLIANIWGEAAQIEESVSTLRFATRMMCVTVEPAVNIHYNPAIMVKNLEKELSLLKKELAMHDTLANRSQITYDPLSEQQRYDIRQQVRQYLDAKIDDIDIVNLRQIRGVFEAFKEIASGMTKEIEERFRGRYTMVDKTSAAEIKAAQLAGLPINNDGELIGDTDSQGFGIGQADTTSRPAQSTVVNGKKAAAKRARSNASPTQKPAAGDADKGSSKTQQVAPSVDQTLTQPLPAGNQIDGEKAGEDTSQERPSTPPPRTEAFEVFKSDFGSEINRILNENKDILVLKKRAYADLAKQVNLTKQEIDNSLHRLTHLKEQRESEVMTLEGCIVGATTPEGDVIISETEYLEIKHLKELKTAYRTNYDDLKGIKNEVLYCQKLVDQCRQRLIQAFDTWYAESYLGPCPTVVPSTHSFHRPGLSPPPQEPDDEEKFARLQRNILLETVESAAFHNAQMRINRRKIYDAAATQFPQKKPPGTPIRAVRNQPPTSLQVQY